MAADIFQLRNLESLEFSPVSPPSRWAKGSHVFFLLAELCNKPGSFPLNKFHGRALIGPLKHLLPPEIVSPSLGCDHPYKRKRSSSPRPLQSSFSSGPPTSLHCSPSSLSLPIRYSVQPPVPDRFLFFSSRRFFFPLPDAQLDFFFFLWLRNP